MLVQASQPPKPGLFQMRSRPQTGKQAVTRNLEHPPEYKPQDAWLNVNAPPPPPSGVQNTQNGPNVSVGMLCRCGMKPATSAKTGDARPQSHFQVQLGPLMSQHFVGPNLWRPLQVVGSAARVCFLVSLRLKLAPCRYTRRTLAQAQPSPN